MKHKDESYRDWLGIVLTEKHASRFLLMAKIPTDKWICPSCFDPRTERLCDAQDMIPYVDFPDTIFCPHCDFDIGLATLKETVR